MPLLDLKENYYSSDLKPENWRLRKKKYEKNEDRKIESSRSKISTHMKLIFAVILLLDELWQPLLSTLNKYENNKCNMFYI